MLVKKAVFATITAAEDGTTDVVVVIDTNPTTGVEDGTTDVEGATASNPMTEVEDAMTAVTTAGLAIGIVLSATTQTLHSARNATVVGNRAETLRRNLETADLTEGTTVEAALTGETTVEAALIGETTVGAAVTIPATAETGTARSATIPISPSERSATVVGNHVATRLESPATTAAGEGVTVDMAAGTMTVAVAMTAGTTTGVAADASEARTNQSRATGPATIVEPTISRAEPRASSAALTHETVAVEATDVVETDASAEATDAVGTDASAEATDVEATDVVETDASAEATDVVATDASAEATGVVATDEMETSVTETDVSAAATGVDLVKTETPEANEVDLGKTVEAGVKVEKAESDQRVREAPSANLEENQTGTRTTVAPKPSVAHEAMTIEGGQHGGGPLPRRLGSPE